MNNETLIMERLDRLEQKIDPVANSAKSIKELQEQLAPRVNEAVKALIIALADLESDFQLEDLVFLIKKVMRNIKNITFALEQLKNLIDFARAVEPLLKSTVPQIIQTFDELEQKGVLRVFTDLPAKLDFSQAEDVGLFGMLRAASDKEVQTGLGVLLELTRGLSALKPDVP
ncbi:MAG: DUF1641 domain-containing protein [Desulfobacteraceae bacterium]|nr:DUF1641 domain-containing protein [Desulfobacteraceae bacterium]